MKKLLIPIALALSLGSYAQKESYIGLTAGIDARNAVLGSSPTGFKPALDYVAGITLVGSSFIVTMNYENFKRIGFEKWSGGIGYTFPLYGNIGYNTIKTSFIPVVNFDMITRKIEGKEFAVLANSIDLTLQWMLTDRLGVQTTLNLAQRPDIQVLYNNSVIVKSGYLKIVYKLKTY